MAKSFRGCFCFQGLRAAIQSQPLAKNRLNLSVQQILNNNLEVHTLPIVPVYRVQTGILFAYSPTFIINSSKCKFAYLLAERRPGSSVRIANDYGLDGPGIESRWGRDFPPVQTGPGAHPASCTMGTGSFPGVKCGRGVLLTTHPLLAPRS